MGTPGYYGFVYKGKIYLLYCHYDGYREGLGINLMREIKYAVEHGLLDVWIFQLENARLVMDKDRASEDNTIDYNIRPTEEEIDKLRMFTLRSSYGGGNKWKGETKWYYLLNGTQGSFMESLGCGYLMPYVYVNVNEAEPYNTYMDYVYIMNFDSMQYEIYYEDDEGNIVEEKFDVTDLPSVYAGIKVETIDKIMKMKSDGERYDADYNEVQDPKIYRKLLVTTRPSNM